MAAGWKDALMADTGAPWFIPYVESGDLVRDYPAASLALGTAIAGGLSAAESSGIGANTVQTIKTNVFSTTSASFVDVTGFDVTITPSSNTAKVLVIVTTNVSNSSAGEGVHLQVLRGATVLAVGDADGNRVQATYGNHINNTFDAFAPTAVFVDAPTSASPVTYKVQMRRGPGGTAVLNRSGQDGNDTSNARSISSITAIEVAA
jgi:hypothetical protein